jgi:hypothetical protein
VWSFVLLPLTAETATVIRRYGFVMLCVRWQIVTYEPVAAPASGPDGRNRARPSTRADTAAT